MDFHYPPRAEQFRQEVRHWLQEHFTPEFQRLNNHVDLLEEDLVGLKLWNKKLAEARYVAIAWPTAYGGRHAGVMEQVVLAEEMSRVGAPKPLNHIGISNIAPSMMAYGTEEQKNTFLYPMLSGEKIWSQGFSESGAGSDLAALQTIAVDDGDSFIIRGQKVWNTLGCYADYCELLARSDPTAKKHRGISCLLVDLKTPGITVRPLITITGGTEFAEIFFDNVKVPKSALLGAVNDGWKVAMNTLSDERAGVANLHLALRKKVAQLIAISKDKKNPLSQNKVVRNKLARVYMMAEMQKALSNQVIAAAANGQSPGPESSIIKIAWSEIDDLIAETSASVLGADALSGYWGYNRLVTRAGSIAGGTTQVNRHIVAQRVLGLPKS